MNLDDVAIALKAACPHGHPTFVSSIIKKAVLHSKKNAEYAGDNEPLGNFNRCAEIVKIYSKRGFQITNDNPVGILLGLVLKHLDNVLFNFARSGAEGLKRCSDSVQDISVYFTILECMLNER